MEARRVVIVGGGLAGASAAVALAKRGRSVQLYERSRQLGGRAGSLPDRDGRLLDLGQHVYLGSCVAYRRFLEELGTSHLAPMQRRLALPMIDPAAARRRVGSLRARPIPFPFSLIGALLGYSHLPWRDRLLAIKIVAQAKREFRREKALGEASAPTGRYPFSEWLRKKQATPAARRALWDPLIVATLNAQCDAVSAYSGLMVLSEALGGGPDSAAIGQFRAPMSQLLEPLPRILAPLGSVELGVNVRSAIVQDGKAVGIALADGRKVEADAVVIAASHDQVKRLLPDAVSQLPYFAQLDRIDAAPIVTVHLWYDRPLIAEPMVGVIDSPIHWLFNPRLLGVDAAQGDGYPIVITVSDARQAMEMPAVHVAHMMDAEIRRLFPAAEQAQRMREEVRKVKRATFLAAPHAAAWRPANATPIPGLFLAGDYTDTGWPSTMESATRSGASCAFEVHRFLKADQ